MKQEVIDDTKAIRVLDRIRKRVLKFEKKNKQYYPHYSVFITPKIHKDINYLMGVYAGEYQFMFTITSKENAGKGGFSFIPNEDSQFFEQKMYEQNTKIEI